MATYKGINGFAVQSVASDPSPLDEGQVWYNNATYAFKLASVTTAGTWASGGNLNTTRDSLSGAGSDSTAFLAFGGYTGAVSSATEKYNGTSWTNNPTGLNTARYQLSGFGTQTAAVAAGGDTGSPSSATEKYNGTSWTNNPTGLNTARRAVFGTGIQTAGLASGGANANPIGNSVETFNGTSWSPATSLNVGLRGGVTGTQTAAVTTAVGTVGIPGPGAGVTQTWNGSTWTSLPAAPYPTSAPSLGDIQMFGPSTSALATGGGDFSTNVTYAPSAIFNGSTWTSSTAQPSSRGASASSGGSSFSDNLLAGGSAGAPSYSVLNSTVEWTGPGAGVTRTVTVS